MARLENLDAFRDRVERFGPARFDARIAADALAGRLDRLADLAPSPARGVARAP